MILFTRTNRSLMFAAAIAFLTLHCAQKPVEKEAAPPAEKPRVLRAVAGTSAPIGKRIEKILELAGLHSVLYNANEETGFVQLFGTVPSTLTRDRLAAVVGSIRGVRKLENDLTISSPAAAAESSPPPVSRWKMLINSRLHIFAALLVAMILWLAWDRRRTPLASR